MSPQPRTIVSQDPVVKAVVSLLTFDTFTAYDNEAPVNPTFPYSVVYSLDDQQRSGPMWDGQADVTHTIQVTCVGETAEQARMLRDKTRPRLLTTLLTTQPISGRIITLVDMDLGGGVERDETEQPRLFYAVDIWLISTTPS